MLRHACRKTFASHYLRVARSHHPHIRPGRLLKWTRKLDTHRDRAYNAWQACYIHLRNADQQTKNAVDAPHSIFGSTRGILDTHSQWNRRAGNTARRKTVHFRRSNGMENGIGDCVLSACKAVICDRTRLARRLYKRARERSFGFFSA